jgi:hypothetical protein
MMNSLHRELVAIGLIGLFTFSMSACTSTTPQENYARFIHSTIGANIDTNDIFSDRTPSSTQILENGNIEYKYPYAGGQCIETYEVDSKTRLIVSASFAGSDKACQLSP